MENFLSDSNDISWQILLDRKAADMSHLPGSDICHRVRVFTALNPSSNIFTENQTSDGCQQPPRCFPLCPQLFSFNDKGTSHSVNKIRQFNETGTWTWRIPCSDWLMNTIS